MRSDRPLGVVVMNGGPAAYAPRVFAAFEELAGR